MMNTVLTNQFFIFFYRLELGINLFELWFLFGCNKFHPVSLLLKLLCDIFSANWYKENHKIALYTVNYNAGICHRKWVRHRSMPIGYNISVSSMVWLNNTICKSICHVHKVHINNARFMAPTLEFWNYLLILEAMFILYPAYAQTSWIMLYSTVQTSKNLSTQIWQKGFGAHWYFRHVWKWWICRNGTDNSTFSNKNDTVKLTQSCFILWSVQYCNDPALQTFLAM